MSNQATNQATDRTLTRVTGADALTFLQGMLSNDVLPLARGDGLVWTALLTPQGKYLADFFVVSLAGEVFLDMKSTLAESTLRRLSMYRLRADVAFQPSDLPVTRGLGTPPARALPDPRHSALGWRGYGAPVLSDATAPIDWDALRVEHCIPETGIELIPDDSYLLETGFERLHGVDFRKGCYVGQEVTARMKHKTELRKGLVKVRVQGTAPIGQEITDADGKPVGQIFTQSGGFGLAYLRFDRATAEMRAADARLWLDESNPA